MSSDLPLPQTDDEINPYAPPQAQLDLEPVELIPTGDPAAAEAIRRAHIGHEASVKSIGLLHYLAMVFLFLVGAGALIFALFQGKLALHPAERAALVIGGVVYLALGCLHLALGRGLRRLQSWARWTDVVLTSLVLAVYLLIGFLMIAIRGNADANDLPALIGIGFLCAILGYILYLLLSSRSATIFSARYKAIIAQTPHIRYRTSLVVKIFVALFIGFVVLALAGALVGYLIGRSH